MTIRSGSVTVKTFGTNPDSESCELRTLLPRRSRPSVLKVISQPRSLGGRCPVDRAAGAALRLIDLTHVRVYSKATYDDFFSAFFDPRSDEDWHLLAFLSSSITSTDKNCSQTKKKRPCKRSFPLSGGLLVSELFQSEKQRSLDDQRHRSDGLRWANRKTRGIVTQSLNWKRGPFFPVPLMVQDFDRRSNPNCPFNHAQTNLTTHEQRRRLHEKFFAPGVNNRRFPSPKMKPCEKLKKSLLFAFGHSLFFPSFFLFFFTFHRRTVELKTDLATCQENLKISRCTETCIGPTVGAVGPTVGAGFFTDLLLFVTMPIFCLERSFLHQNKAWRLGFSKHLPKRKFLHRNDL